MSENPAPLSSAPSGNATLLSRLAAEPRDALPIAERTRILLEVSAAAAEALTPEEASFAVVNFGLRVLDASAGLVSILSQDGRALELVGAVHLPPGLADMLHHVPLDLDMPMSDVVRTHTPVFIESFDELAGRYPRAGEALACLNSEAIVAVPVSGGGRLRGVLGLIFRERRRFDEEERAFIHALSHHCAQAMLRARSYQAEREARAEAERAARRARRLQSVTAALSRALSPRQVIEVIVGEVFDALGASAGAVLELVGSGTEYQLLHAVGYPASSVEPFNRFSARAPYPVRDVARTGEPVFIENREQWLARYEATDGPPAGDGAWAALPLILGGQVFGALTLSFPNGRAFSPDDRDLMIALANHCAQALERARLYADAVAANEAKSNFLAVISHELRTPLTAVIGYTELLATGVVGPVTRVQKHHLDRIGVGAKHLLVLIEDLLRYARIEVGREVVHIQPVSLHRVLEDVGTVVRPLAEQKGLLFRMNAGSVPLRFQSDGPKLKQLLINLLANSVKFTELGEVTLTVFASDDRMVFETSDTGPGIATEHLDHIFDAFWQADQTATRGVGGTGLGLAVVRRLVTLIGGQIRVESELGRGTKFVVSLPLDGGTAATVR